MMAAGVADSRAWLRRYGGELAFLLLLALLAAALLWPALFGGKYLLPGDLVAAGLPDYAGAPLKPQNPALGDAVYAIQPWRSYARAQIMAGHIPLWNPTQLTGTPLLANLQSAVLSPWSWMLYLWPDGAGLGWLAWLKLMMAGIGMGLFLRRLRLAPAAVTLGAASFMLSSHVVVWLQWTIAEVYLLAPWLLWLARGWLDTRRASWLFGWAAAVALAVVGGHAESAFNVLLVADCYTLVHILATARLRRRLLGYLIPIGAAALLGLGISAAQLLPFLAQLGASLQASDRALLKAYLNALAPESLLTWLVPNGLGNPTSALFWGKYNYLEGTAFVGLVALALAALAWLRRPRLEAAFWTALALTGAGIAWGWPGFALLRELPGLSSSLTFRYQSLAQLGIVVLGALGADGLLRAAQPLRARRVALALGVALLVVALSGLAFHLLDDASGTAGVAAFRNSWFGWSLFVLAGLGAAVALRGAGRLTQPGLGALLLLLALADLLRFAGGFNTFSAPALYYPRTPLTARLAAQPGRGAVLGLELSANLSLLYGWRDYRDYDPMLDNRHKLWVRLMSRLTYHLDTGLYSTAMNLWPPRGDMFSAIGLSWVAARDGVDPNVLPNNEVIPAPPLGLAYVARDRLDGFTFWDNVYARPQAYFAREVVPAAAQSIWLAYRDQPSTHWAQTYVEAPDGALGAVSGKVEPPPSASPHDLAVGAGSAGITLYEPGAIELRVERPANQPGLLVVNESWDEGWRATVDGADVADYRANYLEQGIIVPGGKHVVRLLYWPREFEIGAWVSGLSLLVWATGLALLFVRRRSSPRRTRRARRDEN